MGLAVHHFSHIVLHCREGCNLTVHSTLVSRCLQEILAEEPAHELKSLACGVDEEVARRGVAINREYLSLHVRVGSAARDVEVRTGDGGGWLKVSARRARASTSPLLPPTVFSSPRSTCFPTCTNS